MHTQRGFTLIELMIVVAIIAILAAIAITAYTDSITKSQFSEALTISDSLKIDVADDFHQTSTCPANGTQGISAAASYTGNYVASATVGTGADGCTITTQFRNNSVGLPLRGKQVVLTMTDNGGTAVWKCTTNAPPQYVPQVCR